MRKQFIFISVVTIFFCLSCSKRGKRREDIATIIAEWAGKEIIFPQGVSCSCMRKDTACLDLYCENYKILFVIDSFECTSCRLHLFEWSMILKESDTAFLKKPEFLFFFQTKGEEDKELKYLLEHNDFRYPVFIDKENKIGKLNKFPLNPDFKCFLLDKNNKVVLIGNPALTSGIWLLYKRVIRESEEKVKTMEKGGEFFNVNENSIFPSRYPLIKKGGCKNTKLS